jgi:hypothetical protein
MQQLYLTRRNLQTLLNKLNRCRRDGPDASERTLIKRDTLHPVYPCTDVIIVTAVEDEDYYDRLPGTMSPKDCSDMRQGGI